MEVCVSQSLRGPALYQAVRDYIKRYILENDLQPGDPLPPEGQLVEVLGVGRSSVREAVKSLQSLGIIDVRKGDGLYVREINFDPMLETFIFGMQFNPHTLAELLQIRIWLEAAVIGDAVNHVSEDDLAKLDAVLVSWRERIQAGKEYADLDEAFHKIIYGVFNNQTLMKLFSVFWIVFLSLNDEITHDPDPELVLLNHQAIVDAIRNRDPGGTRKQLMRHFDQIEERIQIYLEPLKSEK
jgi:DNA-binding FadR family transcriptional regulator